ncbi:MAG: hypothetical protein ACYTBJ_13515 [Planctomycetota bacterium]|jgi:hypothetical protein
MAEQNNDLVITWIKEATKEMKENRDANTKEHRELVALISGNREEFVIFKTKVNARTAMISTGIGFIALVLSIILNIGSIKERQAIKHSNPEPTEVIDSTE